MNWSQTNDITRKPSVSYLNPKLEMYFYKYKALIGYSTTYLLLFYLDHLPEEIKWKWTIFTQAEVKT